MGAYSRFSCTKNQKTIQAALWVKLERLKTSVSTILYYCQKKKQLKAKATTLGVSLAWQEPLLSKVLHGMATKKYS
jgi:hypothetical protein